MTVPVALSIAVHRRRETFTHGFHRVVALSEFQAGQLAALGVPRERLTVKPHFAEDRGVVPWEQRDASIVYLGRLTPGKGASTLLKAHALLPAPRPRLDVVGEGPLRAELEDMCRRLSIAADVRFHGLLGVADSRSLLGRSRLLLMPSEWYETFGLGVIEAYSHGVPVIASRIAGLPELVEPGATGDLFAPGDATDLAAVLRKALADDAQLRAMGAQARSRYLERFSPAVGLRRLESVYNQAVRAASAIAG
jgi:glycosyltransferase involved in cell wall biosynthesis